MLEPELRGSVDKSVRGLLVKDSTNRSNMVRTCLVGNDTNAYLPIQLHRALYAVRTWCKDGDVGDSYYETAKSLSKRSVAKHHSYHNRCNADVGTSSGRL